MTLEHAFGVKQDDPAGAVSTIKARSFEGDVLGRGSGVEQVFHRVEYGDNDSLTNCQRWTCDVF
jgi:hypothetical protein